jgi:hypothetical protein
MQDSLVALLGKILLWLGGGLFPIVVVASTVPPDSDLAAWREILALLFLGSVMIGTALVVADRELGEG